MKLNIKKIILISTIFILWILYIHNGFAWYDIPVTGKISSVSMHPNTSSDPVNSINNIWFSILWTIKLIVEWLLIIFIVYIWAQMIWSMWADEETLNKAKRQLRYSVLAILFINITWTLYDSFHKTEHWNIGTPMHNATFQTSTSDNIFFDLFTFWNTFWSRVVWFLEVAIFAIAIVALMWEALKLIMNRWKEDHVSKAKEKIAYSVLALIFVWIIKVWKSFAFSLDISKVTNIFSELANLALFFAGPIAFFFLTIAAYYYITAWGEEEKVKKAKSIVINTILATLILLASYTFLLDLSDL
jgi:hypothetical protein